jgi:MFS superfamily sulfate permease-like transporter
LRTTGSLRPAKNLGYAGIAGVPVQNSLYAAAAGALIYALFCTSRHISTGPSSSLAAVAGRSWSSRALPHVENSSSAQRDKLTNTWESGEPVSTS